MSLSKKIAAAVEAARDRGEAPLAVEAADGGHRLSLSLSDAGPVGLAFESLEFAPEDDAPRAPAALRAWADRLAARLSYLMEPLAVVEQDALANELTLRSKAPTTRGEQRSYYEVVLRPTGALRLGRVAFDESSRRRRPVPCQLTVEALERLADDLVAVAVAV